MGSKHGWCLEPTTHSSLSSGLEDPQTDKEQSPGFINSQHVYNIQEQKSLGKGTVEHTPVLQSK